MLWISQFTLSTSLCLPLLRVCQEGQTRILIDKSLADVKEGSWSQDAKGMPHGSLLEGSLRVCCAARACCPSAGLHRLAPSLPLHCRARAAVAGNVQTQWAEAGSFLSFVGEREWAGRNDTRLAAVAGPIGPGSQRIPVSGWASLSQGGLEVNPATACHVV